MVRRQGRARLVVWYMALRREIDAPELWASVLTQAAELRETTNPDDNSRLTAAEIRHVGDRVAAARILLLDAGLVAEALVDANRKLDYLVDTASRMGRYDWRNTAIGVGLTSASLLRLILNAPRNS